jgi:uncharacterized membrane protein YbhN (UPF0104 family)
MKAFVLKLVISLGLLAFFLSRIDFSQFLRVVASANLFYFVLILFAYAAGQVVSCVRWIVLAHPLGFRFSFKNYLSFYFIGMFFNLFAPSTIGGDASRVFYLTRESKAKQQTWGRQTTHALVAVLTDRIVGMAVMVWMAACALVLFPQYPVPNVVRYVTFGLSLACLASWFFLPLVNRVLRWLGYSAGEYLRLSLETYWGRQQIIVNSILLSIVVHLNQGAMQFYLAKAVGLDIPWSYGFILYPLVGIFSALPISFNGIGLREGGYLFLLTQIGVSSEKAIAVGLLWFLVIVLDSLIGGVLYVARRRDAVSEDPARA